MVVYHCIACLMYGNGMRNLYDVICLVSMLGGRENYMIEFYKGEFIPTLCSIRILCDKMTRIFTMD